MTKVGDAERLPAIAAIAVKFQDGQTATLVPQEGYEFVVNHCPIVENTDIWLDGLEEEIESHVGTYRMFASESTKHSEVRLTNMLKRLLEFDPDA